MLRIPSADDNNGSGSGIHSSLFVIEDDFCGNSWVASLSLTVFSTILSPRHKTNWQLSSFSIDAINNFWMYFGIMLLLPERVQLSKVIALTLIWPLSKHSTGAVVKLLHLLHQQACFRQFWEHNLMNKHEARLLLEELKYWSNTTPPLTHIQGSANVWLLCCVIPFHCRLRPQGWFYAT